VCRAAWDGFPLLTQSAHERLTCACAQPLAGFRETALGRGGGHQRIRLDGGEGRALAKLLDQLERGVPNRSRRLLEACGAGCAVARKRWTPVRTASAGIDVARFLWRTRWRRRRSSNADARAASTLSASWETGPNVRHGILRADLGRHIARQMKLSGSLWNVRHGILRADLGRQIARQMKLAGSLWCDSIASHVCGRRLRSEP
jgi:hypothetical protein